MKISFQPVSKKPEQKRYVPPAGRRHTDSRKGNNFSTHLAISFGNSK